MSKPITAIFGIAIAVVVYVSMLLGIQAFYPEVRYKDYCPEDYRYDRLEFSFENCAEDITVGECRSKIEEKQSGQNECEKQYEAASDVYNKNFFLIASVLGLIAVIIAFVLLNMNLAITNVSLGVACAGIVMILWGFIRGWESADDMLKFIVGLIVAAIVIFMTIKLNKKK